MDSREIRIRRLIRSNDLSDPELARRLKNLLSGDDSENTVQLVQAS